MKKLALVVVIFLSACQKTKAPDIAKASAELSYEETVEMCVELHQESLKCPAEFVGMNIDLRSQYSPEFAKMMSDPAVRAEAQAVGIEETKTDGGPAAKERCQEYAKPEWGPPTMRATEDGLDGCYKLSSCDEKMACMRPFIEPRFKYRAEQEKLKSGQ